MHNKKTCPFWLILCLLSVNLFGQDATVISGGEIKGNGGELSFSVGQLFTNSISQDGKLFQEGVQQPFEISHVFGISEQVKLELGAVVYPNPSESNLFLQLPTLNFPNISYQIIDVNGRELSRSKILSDKTEIDVNGLSSGIYFLNVFEGYRLLQSFKVIKN